jgi:Protein of unknown function (DUF3592)
MKLFFSRLGRLSVCIFVLGSCLLLAGLFSFDEEEDFLAHAVASKGVITRFECSNISEPCVPFIHFKLNTGESVEAGVHCCSVTSLCVWGRCVPRFSAIGAGTRDLEVGQQIPVLYNPDNPKDVQIQAVDPRPHSFQTSRLLTLGGFLTLVGLLLSIPILLYALISWVLRRL